MLLGREDEQEKYNGQKVLEVVNAINDEIPNTQDALVPIGVDLVGIVELVGDQLMPLASFELHLLLEVLIFVALTAPFVILRGSILSVFLSESLLIGSFVSQVLHDWDSSWSNRSIDSTVRYLTLTDCWHTVDPLHTCECLVDPDHVVS